MNRESDFVGTHLGGGYEGSREGPQQPRHEGAKVPHVLEKHEVCWCLLSLQHTELGVTTRLWYRSHWGRHCAAPTALS